MAEKPKRTRKPKSIPVWQPEKFEGFWRAYPRDEDRAKAVEQWDMLPKLLRPESCDKDLTDKDKALISRYGGKEELLLRDMSVGLRRHLESKQWKDDVGIPYAFRWLRDRRWTEKTKRPAASSALPAPSPSRSFHTEMVNGEEVVIYDESS